MLGLLAEELHRGQLNPAQSPQPPAQVVTRPAPTSGRSATVCFQFGDQLASQSVGSSDVAIAETVSCRAGAFGEVLTHGQTVYHRQKGKKAAYRTSVSIALNPAIRSAHSCVFEPARLCGDRPLAEKPTF